VGQVQVSLSSRTAVMAVEGKSIMAVGGISTMRVYIDT